jgi:transposase InsO family protein
MRGVLLIWTWTTRTFTYVNTLFHYSFSFEASRLCRRFPTQVEARMAVFDFIEGWYNPHRRHSGLDYLSPISYEQRHPVVA